MNSALLFPEMAPGVDDRELLSGAGLPYVPSRPPDVEFFAAGRPIPKGSFCAIMPKYASRATGRRIPFCKPSNEAALDEWSAAVNAAAIAAYSGLFWRCPVIGAYDFILRRPQAHYTARGGLRADAPAHHATQPDVDKLIRAVNDPLKHSILMDDSQVVVALGCKLYGDDEGVRVRLWGLE